MDIDIFLINKYTKWYYNIIQNRKNNPFFGYTEKHHIIPKSLGGSNEADNLIKLTAREHFICHLLLTKMTTDKNKQKMSYAIWRMVNLNKYCVSSRTYETIRKDHALLLSESKKGSKREPFSDEWKKNMSMSQTGKKMTITETGMIGKKKAGETRRGREPWNKGKDSPYGKETLEKMSNSFSKRMKGVPKKKTPCKYCGIEVAPNMLNRYHNDNCKKKS